MSEFDFLRDLIVVLGVSIGVVYLFDRFRLPVLVGFLVAGILLGPYGLDIVHDVSRIEIFAEIGVVVLLFTVGVEFSLTRVRALRAAVGGGLLQIGLAIGLTAAVAAAMGLSLSQGFLWGCLVAMSSTAIVFKLLSERGETTAPHGRLAAGVLIVQDLAVVPIMLFIPILDPTHAGGVGSAWWPLLQTAGLAALILVGARVTVPAVLAAVVRSRSRELFVMTVVLVCVGIAWLCALAGLSLPIGAFIAGLMLSESEYSHQALAEMLPLRDGLSSLFFVSIGMLFDLGTLVSHPFLVAGLVVAVIVGKTITAAGAATVMGYPWRHALLMGLALAQVGEFSFILSKAGQGTGLLSGPAFQIFLAVSILTMALTPFLIRGAAPLADRLERALRGSRWMTGPSATPVTPEVTLQRHTIIAGYGMNGRNLSRILHESAIPFVVVELNGEVVAREQRHGIPIHFGDVTHPRVLHQLGIDHARAVVLAISDPAATRRAVAVAKQLNPRVRVIARTRYLKEIDDLHALGADQVVPEEFETSIEIFGLVLQTYQVPVTQVAEQIERIRREGYALLRRDGPSWKDPITGRIEGAPPE